MDHPKTHPIGKLPLLILLMAVIALAAVGMTATALASGPQQGLSARILENSPGGASLGSPLGTTAPAGTVRYSLAGPDAASFTMDPATGEVSLAQGVSPDFEAKNSYSVTITATADVTVEVVNASEPGAVSLSADEPAAGETITAALADPDGGISNLSWAWARVRGEETTAITGAGGDSYTTSAADIGRRISATASYDDRAGTGQSASAITALSVRNDPPAFPASSEAREVREGAASGTPVGAPVVASDPNDDALTYALEGHDAFRVDPSSGQISVAHGAGLDHEAEPVHTLTVTATDAHGAPAQVTVTVNVSNVDEPGAMRLDHGPLRRGTVVTAVLVDPDGSVSGETWAWSRSGAAIAGAADSAHTATAADVGHILTAHVSYTDGHGPGKSASAATASAVGNDAPSFPAGETERSIDENGPPGAPAGAPVTAQDPNGDTVSHSLTGSAAFSINDETGAITANHGLDHEEQAVHTVTVTAADEHGATASTTVTITVNNLDEAGAVTLDNTAPRAGDTISAALSDPDGETSGEAWQWQRSGADIPGANSASYTAGADDLGHTLRATVSYADPQGAGKSAVSQDTAAVSNDPPAFTTAGPVSIAVAENATVGTIVGSPLDASDPNGDDLFHSLSGPDAAGFSIDGNGQITTAASLDHEAQASHSLTATVSDPAGGSDSIAVSVTVTNVEEPGTVHFGTNAQPEVGTALTASLSDPDGAVTGEAWQWQSSDSAEGPWSNISGANSASYTPAAGDVDSHLRASVTYRDGHGAGEDTASAATALPVRPEPNRPPAFDEARTDFGISINVREGVRVAPPFTATDPNGDDLTYSIAPDTPDSFTIDAATGEVVMGSLEVEEGDVFTATVSVTDGFGEDGYPDGSADDTLGLTMTMVDPNLHVEPESAASFPRGLWRDNEVILVANKSGTTGQVLVYDVDTGAELEDRKFDLTTRYPAPKGVWSDGVTVYIVDDQPGRGRDYVRAYRLRDGKRQSGKDIRLAGAQRRATGIWSDGATLYVGDNQDRKLYAYNLGDGSRDSGRDVSIDPGRRKEITDFWSDGETVWAGIWLHEWVLAFDLETGSRVPRLDIQLARENLGPTGVFSDGFHFWAMDRVEDTIYGYVLPR